MPLAGKKLCAVLSVVVGHGNALEVVLPGDNRPGARLQQQSRIRPIQQLPHANAALSDDAAQQTLPHLPLSHHYPGPNGPGQTDRSFAGWVQYDVQCSIYHEDRAIVSGLQQAGDQQPEKTAAHLTQRFREVWR
jgi:hypothetical protein